MNISTVRTAWGQTSSLGFQWCFCLLINFTISRLHKPQITMSNVTGNSVMNNAGWSRTPRTMLLFFLNQSRNFLSIWQLCLIFTINENNNARNHYLSENCALSWRFIFLRLSPVLKVSIISHIKDPSTVEALPQFRARCWLAESWLGSGSRVWPEFAWQSRAGVLRWLWLRPALRDTKHLSKV